MRDQIRRFLALIAAAALLAPAGWAQNPQQAAPPPAAPLAPQVSPNQKGTIRATVNLVEVDVEVTDRNGNPIKGLKQDQFSVAENGKDQKISAFDYYDVERLEKAAAEDVAPITIPIGSVSQPEQVRQQIRDRRLIVLFFDLTSLQPSDLTRSTLAAKQFLSKQMTPADLVGVVAFGNQLKVVADFTNDRDLLNSAVDALLPGKESQLAALAAATSTGIDAATTEDTDAAFTADDTEFNVFNTDRKLIAIESLADLLKDIPGKKSVMQFTSGITQTGEDNRSQLRATTDASNRANMSIYTVDSRGLLAEIPGGDASVGASAGNAMFTGAAVFQQSQSRQDSRETLATLAADTGGRTLLRSRRSRPGLPFGAGRYRRLLPRRLLQHGRPARRPLAQHSREACRRARSAHSLPRGLLRAQGFRRLHHRRSRAPAGRRHALRGSRGGAAHRRGNRLLPPRQ